MAKEPMRFYLCLRQFPQTTNGAPYGSSRSRRYCPCTASNCLFARVAMPDTNGGTLNRILTAEGAGIPGVLRDFHLFHLLTQGSTITSAVFSGDTNFACAFGHIEFKNFFIRRAIIATHKPTANSVSPLSSGNVCSLIVELFLTS